MRNNRLLATTALLTAALGLSLTACGPDSTPSAGASSARTAASPSTNTDPGTSPSSPSAPSAAAPSAAPVANAPTPVALPTTRPSAKPTASKPAAKPTAAPTTPTTPTADCTANANHPGHTVINATVGWADPDRIGANATKFVCGPDVPNDGYYQPVNQNSSYTFAPGATAHLVGQYASEGGMNVSIDTLLTHIVHCTTNNPTGNPSPCYGNNYDITVDGSGRITSISELYHP
ncbi:hypothetical protein [Kitasatospora sp. NBC_01266]|uniref:hypothetical protein n=1 Tax=Kitasatospora sp. NBC_01266 TaxID=2903572 RepID=UPI002E375D3A|nr:hypothetical protein [Kitasatospora sp. NBC_01266]